MCERAYDFFQTTARDAPFDRIDVPTARAIVIPAIAVIMLLAGILAAFGPARDAD